MDLKDIKEFCSKQYRDINRRVIVIVLARYLIKAVREMVDSHYEYWHHYSETNVDFFWLGYELDENLDKNTTPFNLSSEDNLCTLVFHTKKYVKEVKTLSSILGNRLGDPTGYLICDYYDGDIHFDDSVLIKIDDLLKSDRDADLRDVTDCLIRACSREKEAKNVGTIIRNEMRLSAVKGKLGTFSENILTGAGIILQFFSLVD